jgi:uncharacterized membrane protein YphA (DoxX/SURF4 family)
MKAISLLLLRLSTGIYLILWGLVKLGSKDMAVKVSETYYNGIISGDFINYALGGAEVLIGALVAFGLFRSIAYLGQLAFYLVGALAIITSLVDPFGIYLASSAKLTFFPSWTLLFASLVLIVFKEEDSISLDKKLGK